MQTVGGEILLQQAASVDHVREVVDVEAGAPVAVALEPLVEGENLFRRALGEEVPGAIGVIVNRQYRREDDANPVGAGKLGERGVVVIDVLETHRTGVAGDVVGASENDDSFRMQVDDVLAEAYEHL